MPDSTKRTVSASQVAALFGEHPDLTPFLLYHQFIGDAPPIPENEFMTEGRRMQPLIIGRAAKELNLVTTPNEQDEYVRRGPLGCTRDARIEHPERGPGALEAKAVYNYGVWKDKWDGGNCVPRHIEMQLAAQIFVGNGESAFLWGVIAAWNCAHQWYFERTAQVSLWEIMEREAAAFLKQVAERREPDPSGSPLEVPLIAQLYPLAQGKVLDLREHERGDELTRKVYTAQHSHERAGIHGGVYDSIRAELIGVAKDHDRVLLPDRTVVSFSGKNRRMNIYAPERESVTV